MSIREECGVFGIYDRAGTEDVAAAAYSALYALQHRGQESCGIAVNDDGVIRCVKIFPSKKGKYGEMISAMDLKI